MGSQAQPPPVEQALTPITLLTPSLSKLVTIPMVFTIIHPKHNLTLIIYINIIFSLLFPVLLLSPCCFPPSRYILLISVAERTNTLM